MINLEKGQKVKLEKESGEKLRKVLVGCGWDAKEYGASGSEFDLDASAYLLGADGKVRSNNDFIFYGNLTTPSRDVVHTGDNLTGEGDGDDEQLIIDLEKLDSSIEKIVIVVNIYQAEQRGQNFGMIENSFIRIVNTENNEEMFHFDLNFESCLATGVQFATIFRKGDSWAISADQKEFEGGLSALNQIYGVR